MAEEIKTETKVDVAPEAAIQPPAEIKTAGQEPVQQESKEAKAVQKEERTARKFSALAKQEAKVKAEREQAKADRDAAERARGEFQSRVQDFEARVQKLGQAEQLLQSDPLKFLDSVGVKVEDILGRIANDGKQSPEKVVEQLVQDKLNEFEAKQRKAQEDYQRAVQQKQVEQAKVWEQNARNEIAAIAANDERFELVHRFGAINDVYDTQAQYFQDTGEILPWEDVMAEVEEHLLNEASSSKKLTKREAAAAAAEVKAETKADVAKSTSKKPKSEEELRQMVRTLLPKKANDGTQTAVTSTNQLSQSDLIKRIAQSAAARRQSA